MTGEDRRLVALAVALDPRRALRLLARLGGPDAEAARRLAGSLAERPRRARLAALASALAEAPVPAPADGPPLLRRLELERRLARSAGETPVRGTSVPCGAGPRDSGRFGRHAP